VLRGARPDGIVSAVTRWAWVIDQTKCIGCHACTTACKSENHVAVGVFRTWVKNVDVGTFPEVRRHFAVLRCNHCEDAPCVEICPVTAMYQRADGLVDFDEALCIGCKACMQACPYDAIYMDPDSDTAAKCNFCSHRVDEGLLPACVVVCPVEALLFGDMDDPASKVGRALEEQRVSVRRPEQRTRPKAFYIGAHEATLDPLAARHDGMYAWADGPTAYRPDRNGAHATARPTGRPAVLPAVVAYDIPRQRTWGWKVSSYIWTKSIAAGAALIPALMRTAGLDTSGPLFARLAPALALLFLAFTGALLVADLKRPERFWTILVRPQWRSWLARGAYVISAYGGLLTLWAWASWTGRSAWLDALAWPVALLSLATATYTAFLFAQCEGRDLWQSPLLLVELALHAPIAGCAILLALMPRGTSDVAALVPPLGAALALTGLLALISAFGRHPTPNASAAAHALVRGPQAALFWTSLAGGILVPMLILAAGIAQLLPLAGALALAGLWIYGHALVLAGQGPPIS
jgi:Fe-S-cluster-containing dehydrogenase component/formate-dependent nitrite reductase membrane component NrfD